MRSITISINEAENGWVVTVTCLEDYKVSQELQPRTAIFKKASEAAEWVEEIVERLG